MIPEDLQEISYRGELFYISGSEISGGRKDVKKEVANSDLQVIEDLGLKERVFVIEGEIATRRDTNNVTITPYKQMRDRLLDALEKGGTGVLIHPWYGRIDDVACRTFSINENLTRLGVAKISITFEISNFDGVPFPNESALINVGKFHDNLMLTLEENLADIWEVTSKSTGNFSDAMTKLDGFVDSVNEATSPIAALSNKINEHTKLVTDFSVKATTLINNPLTLADSVMGVMQSIGSLYATADGMLAAFKKMFDFGDFDIDAPQFTSIAIERKRNNDVFNLTVQVGALSYSYFNASKIEYSTVEKIVKEATELEVQYQKLFDDPNVDSEVLDSLADLRVATQKYFDEQKLSASRIITIQTNPISIRTLAYNHYGSSDRGEEIAELNDLYDLAYHQGDIEIFTP